MPDSVAAAPAVRNLGHDKNGEKQLKMLPGVET